MFHGGLTRIMEKSIFGFNIAFLKQVNSLMGDSNIEELEIEEGDSMYLRISKEKPAAGKAEIPHPLPENTAQTTLDQAKAVNNAHEAPEKNPYDDESKYCKILSPVIGTFYEAPNPQSPPFVKRGDTVSKDTTVCIVEAMKIMNEIKAEIEGRIVEIFKSNGSPVHSGEAMFLIELK
jgi:acetyl-CoA carboxylase biotin carboxyl carrier protein